MYLTLIIYQAEVARETERRNINRSLLTLGRVIKMLKEQNEGKRSNKNIRIPYRDSKLTRILQESLGGRCKTLVVATLSPSVTAIEESISTLNYAQCANGIMNKPMATSYLSLGNSSVSSSSLDSGNSDPKTVEHWHEMECRLEYMKGQVEESQAALARQHMQQQELVERTEKAEENLLQSEKKLFESEQEKSSLKDELNKEKTLRIELASLQYKTEVSLKQTAAILEATQKTEATLTMEANILLTKLAESLKEGDELFRNLVKSREDDMGKRIAARTFNTEALDYLGTVLSNLEALSCRISEHSTNISNNAQEGHNREKENLSLSITMLQNLRKDLENITDVMKNRIKSEDKLLASLVKTARDGIQKASSSFTEGENNLDLSLELIQSNFAGYGKELSSMREHLNRSSRDALNAIQQNMLESREKISSLISFVSKSLSEVRSKHLETRKKIVSEEKNLEGILTASSMNIEKLSQKQQQSIDGSINEFKTSGTENFNCMNKTLSDQIDYIDEKNSHYNITSGKFVASLQEQRNKFNEAQREQKGLQDTLVTCVMSEVEKVIKTHLDTFAKQQEKHLFSFEDGLSSLTGINKNMNMSVKDIVEQVKETNGSVLGQVTLASKNEDTFTNAVINASSTFSDISEEAKKQISQVQSHRKRFETNIGELSAQDVELQNCGRSFLNSLNEIQDANSNYIRVEKALTDLTEVAGSNLDYAKDEIISGCQTNIYDLQVPRSALRGDLNKKFDATSKVLKEGSSQMKKSFTEQCLVIDGLRDKVDSAVGNFCADTDRKEIEMKAYYDSLETSALEIKKKSNEMVSGCTEKSLNLKECIGHFVREKIQCHEEAPPIMEYQVPQYSQSLTSTPSPNVILEAVELPEPPNLDITGNSISTTSESSHSSLSPDSLHDNKCCASESKLPLGEISLEKQNISDNNSKQDDNSINQKQKGAKSIPPKGSKKRSSSRQRATPVRKRFAVSTPTRRQKNKWKERK